MLCIGLPDVSTLPCPDPWPTSARLERQVPSCCGRISVDAPATLYRKSILPSNSNPSDASERTARGRKNLQQSYWTHIVYRCRHPCFGISICCFSLHTSATPFQKCQTSGGEASYSLLEGKRHMHPYIRLLLLTSCFGASSFYETSLDLSLCSLKAFKLDKQHTKPPKQHRQTKAYFSNIFQSQPQSF